MPERLVSSKYCGKITEPAILYSDLYTQWERDKDIFRYTRANFSTLTLGDEKTKGCSSAKRKIQKWNTRSKKC